LFRFNKFTPSPLSLKKESSTYIQQQAVYEENRVTARISFDKIQKLIGQIKTKEVIASTSEPQTADEVKSKIQEETQQRKSIREDRLAQYLEMAQKDQAFQNEALEILTEIRQDLTELRTLRKELLSAIRLVSGATNRGDKPTKVTEPKKSYQPSTVLKHNAEQTRSGPYSTPHIQHHNQGSNKGPLHKGLTQFLLCLSL
jgi:hypothetical protein